MLYAQRCADISTFCWVWSAAWAGIDVAEFPNIEKWMHKIAKRPAVKEGLDIPEPNMMKEVLENPEKMKQMIADAQAMMVRTK
jgi:glutathione S-transferase